MPTTVKFDSVAELLVHDAPMLLLSEVSDIGDEFAEAIVELDGSCCFSTADGSVPAWLGIEYMAQTIGLFAGFQAKANNRPNNIGFLLGSHKYTAYSDSFAKGSRLLIRAERKLHDANNLVMFDCTIHLDGNLQAQADVKAIQPDNFKETLKGF